MIRALNSADKTALIMSRFRPIAPKPHPPSDPTNPSPPTRTRKRPRPTTHFPSSSVSDAAPQIPRERDLLRLLQAPPSTFHVITPLPVRPVRSVIRVGSITEARPAVRVAAAAMKLEEAEREVESEVLPAVVSDSRNRVRVANLAYKEMVGQPECSWLDSVVLAGDSRIGGGVTLQLSDDAAALLLHCSNGFCCWARINWRNGDGKKICVTAFCDVVKISCASRDFFFIWRFNTRSRDKNLNSVCMNV